MSDYCAGLLRPHRSQHGVSEAGGDGMSLCSVNWHTGLQTATSEANLPLPLSLFSALQFLGCGPFIFLQCGIPQLLSVSLVSKKEKWVWASARRKHLPGRRLSRRPDKCDAGPTLRWTFHTGFSLKTVVQFLNRRETSFHFVADVVY